MPIDHIRDELDYEDNLEAACERARLLRKGLRDLKRDIVETIDSLPSGYDTKGQCAELHAALERICCALDVEFMLDNCYLGQGQCVAVDATIFPE